MGFDRPCPSTEQLAAFSQGRLDEESLQAVGQHLLACADCISSLDALEEAEEGIFADLRRFPEQRPWSEDPGLLTLEARVRTIPLAGLAPALAAPGLPVSTAVGACSVPLRARLGPYDVEEVLGRGGMGAVFRAVHRHLGKRVALKVILPEHAATPGMLARFRREMRAVGQLSHPGIVAATDAGEAEGYHFLVMEFVEGLDLSALLRRCGPLAVADACEIIRQAAVALQYIHEHGRIHRDVKPSNLMLAADGRVKILDLGLALILCEGAGSEELTWSNQVMGTADYMAPEQWADSHAVDIRADIYSLGCTLYKLLTGTAPFAAKPGSHPLAKKLAHDRLEAPALPSSRPDIPAELAAAVERMLAKEPAQRFSKPAEVAEALQPFARGSDCRALLVRARASTAAAADRTLPEPSTAPGRHTQIPADSPTVTAGGSQTGSAASGRAPPPKVAGPAPAKQRSRLARAVLLLTVAASLVLLTGLAVSHWGSIPHRSGGAGLPDGADTNLDQPRSLVPRQWNNLFASRPSEFFWRDPTGDSFWSFDAKAQRLRVQTLRPALLSLGHTDAPGYTLQIYLRQEQWTGGVGIFFGGKHNPDTSTYSYQLLELRPGPPPTGRPFILLRAVESLRTHPGPDPRMETHGLASYKLPESPGSVEQILEIVVDRRHGGLTAVRWNGRPCAALGDGPGGKVAGADYQGELGIYCRSCSVQVKQAMLFPTE